MESAKLVCVVVSIVGLSAACDQVISGAPADEDSALEQIEETCDAPRLLCGGECIDPLSDVAYCGARDDCVGDNAGAVCLDGATCDSGECIATEIIPSEPMQAACINCSFESGDLTGWEVLDLTDPFLPLVVGPAGVTSEPPFFPSQPTDGEFSIVHGFDGDGPGLISIGQVFDLPQAERTTMTFDYRAAWDLLTFGATESRAFMIQVDTPEGLPIMATYPLTAEVGTIEPDTGPQVASVDLSQFAGQTVRVSFAWDVPEYYSGPAFFQLDNVKLVSE